VVDHGANMTAIAMPRTDTSGLSVIVPNDPEPDQTRYPAWFDGMVPVSFSAVWENAEGPEMFAHAVVALLAVPTTTVKWPAAGADSPVMVYVSTDELDPNRSESISPAAVSTPRKQRICPFRLVPMLTVPDSEPVATFVTIRPDGDVPPEFPVTRLVHVAGVDGAVVLLRVIHRTSRSPAWMPAG